VIIDGADPYRGPSFSLRSRLRRQLWDAVWLVVFRPTPRFLYSWRNILLRLFGARLGRHVHINQSVRIWAPWNLELGSYVGVGRGAILYSMASIVIEDYAVISQGAHLCAGSHDHNSPNFQLIARPIRVGRRVWLCADSFVGLGTEIAEGCVIGARAVVVKSIEDPWTVWVGSPAKVVGKRIPIADGE